MRTQVDRGAPRITVCVPGYEQADSIGVALLSVLEQDRSDVELLVIDDASTDGTADVAAAVDPAVRVVRNPVRLGLVGNHNRGLELARGELLQYLHGDDRLLPGGLEALATGFADPRVVLAGAPRDVRTSDAAYLEDFGQVDHALQLREGSTPGTEVLRRVLAQRIFSNRLGEPTALMLRTATARSLGGFDERLRQLMDLDMWSRMLTRGDLWWVKRPLSVRVHHPGNASVQQVHHGGAEVRRTLANLALARSATPGNRARAVLRMATASVDHLRWAGQA